MSQPNTPAAPAAPQTQPTEAPVSEQAIPAAQAPAETPTQDTDADMDSDLDSELSAEQQIDQAQADGKITKQEAADLKKKYKIKVDGEESEVEIDLSDEKEITKILQMAKAFQKRGGEFTKAQQQLLAKMQEIDNNPEDYFSKKGVDLDAWAVERIQKKVQELEKTPEQKAQEALQAELEQLRKEKAEAEKEKEAISKKQAQDEQARILEEDITKALTAAGSRLPDKDPYTLQRLSAYMLSQMADGNVGITVEEAVKVLEGGMKQDLPQFFGKLDEDAILEFLGEENFERVRKKRYQQKKASVANTNTTTAKQVAKDTGTKKTVDSDEPRPKKPMKSFFGRI